MLSVLIFSSALQRRRGLIVPIHRDAETNGKASRRTLLRLWSPSQALQMATMNLGHMGDNRQPQPAMALLPSGGIEAMKGLKCLFPFAGRHSFTLIPDVDAAA